ncbi:hypothetical protein HPB51_026490 [Rhipicephalus microplus]|uniref:DDE-1 domain-containing protein n=1 Tax=Rhipicephalus microplus TaxID=6941 RepID=A0A9J6D3I0_RHIMP|nr:hypothetical protein HPB51_026490 [Rhipicephalus microplus]
MIQNVKHHFKGLLVQRLLAKIERRDENLQISLLDAIHFLAMSWDNVVQASMNCFHKCGFFSRQDAAPTKNNEEPDADLHIMGCENLETEASVRNFITADDNVATCGLRSIEELGDEVKETESDSDGEDVDVCDLPSMPESHHSLDVLRRTVSAGNNADFRTKFNTAVSPYQIRTAFNKQVFLIPG